MFYDLNVQWTSAKDPELPRMLAFLAELGYNIVALNHTITGKLPADSVCAIPDPLPFALPPNLTVLRRCTLHLNESASNARLNALANLYDLFALRPIDEKTLQNAAGNLDCDLISLDLSQRMGYHFKFKTVSEAIKRGVRFEICYSQGLMGDANARRNLISNATGLIRATRGRGIVVASEANKAVACRAPWDVVNLAAIWGLAQDRGYEAVSKEARAVVVTARLRRTSYRGVIDVVYGGEKPAAKAVEEKAVKGGNKDAAAGKKRKAEALEIAEAPGQDKPLSKREQKRRANKARLEAHNDTPTGEQEQANLADGASGPPKAVPA